MKQFKVFLSTLVLFLGIGMGLQAQQEDASAAGLYNEGLEKLKAKDYAAALPLMEKAVEVADPESETDAQVIQLAKRNGSIAAYYVGNEQRKSEDFEGAQATYQLGIDYNPGFYANYIGLAQALEGKGATVDAVKAYLQAAQVCAGSEKTADKVETMEKKASNLVIRAYVDKKIDEAMAAAEAHLALRETAEMNVYMAKALKDKGQAAKSLEFADKAIAMMAEGEDGDQYYLTKGEAHEALGQSAEAIAAYKKVKGAKYGEVAKYRIDQLGGGR